MIFFVRTQLWRSQKGDNLSLKKKADFVGFEPMTVYAAKAEWNHKDKDKANFIISKEKLRCGLKDYSTKKLHNIT